MNEFRYMDSQFLLWIGNPDISNDFTALEMFLKTDCTEAKKFLECFLTGKKISRKYQPKLLIPTFYSNIPEHVSTIPKYGPNDKLSKQKIGKIIQKHYGIPSFFAEHICNAYGMEIMKNKGYLQFKYLEDFFTKISGKKQEEKIFYSILCNKKEGKEKECLLPNMFLDIIDCYIIEQMSNLKNAGLDSNENEKIYSAFISYIISRLFIIYDPEFRGNITKMALSQNDFMKSLDLVSDFEDFQVIYERFMNLDTECKHSITMSQLASYDSNRVDILLVKRALNILPSVLDEQEISFGNFVSYVTLLDFKETPAALNFWFRVCDLDDDGEISFSELIRLYRKQKRAVRKEAKVQKFHNILPYIIDMLNLQQSTSITRAKLKNSNLWRDFFNIFVDSYEFKMMDLYELTEQQRKY